LPSESLRVAYAYADGNSDGNGNSYADSNDDSSSDAHAYSDGATTDNTYTTAPSNAAAAPVALFGNVKAGTRESIREFLQGVKGGTRSPRSFCRGSRVGCKRFRFCRRHACHYSVSQAARPPFGQTRPVASLPLQSPSIDHDYFALVRPLVCGCHKASADRIVPHVVPFLGVTFVAAQNVIKESGLPNSR